MKSKVEYRVAPNLPPSLSPLMKLAYNTCFSWKEEIQDIFTRIDPRLWRESSHNPVLVLGLVSQERLNELARDQVFLSQLEAVTQDFERYMSRPRLGLDDYSPGQPFIAAYFSAEFGLAKCLPIYSGGLGILSGDHLKSASDLNVPLVGVGLLYQQGYFSQYLSEDGWQMETYPDNDFENMPVRLLLDDQGEPLKVYVDFKDERVAVQIWRIDVGRVPLFMLDTNLKENSQQARRTTAQLYGGDREMRIRQEIVLGIGGLRALKTLGIEPTIIHMNEGHSAFSALERINLLRKERNLGFDEAREVVLSSTVFTTHTPVPAGNDTFDPELVRSYLERYVQELGISFRVLLGYGRLDPKNDKEPFGMTTLALRLSAHTNGVSRLHGQVSRAMWRRVWPHHPVEDVPIEHITNGIHVPTWISRGMAQLFDRYLGPQWAEDPDNERLWDRVSEIPSTELWRTHIRQRERLVGWTRQALTRQLKARGSSEEDIRVAGEVLTPEALTIGFARRFATYKRATLLFRDPDRLARIMNDPERPVQIIIAGKAHPQDNEGKEFIRQIVHLARREPFRRRVVFLEDYSIEIGQQLVSGVDLWLNTPRRPLEACGTSGMKALANGALNLSVLDGWWDEGYAPEYGWAIGQGETYQDLELQDNIESQEIYNLLERQIVPLFYQRGLDDLPRDWVEKMRGGLRFLLPVFNSHRMVQEYVNRFYLPCSQRYNTMRAGEFEGARQLASWRGRLMTGWQEVRVAEVWTEGPLERRVGEEIPAGAKVNLGPLSPEDVTVELYYGPLDPQGEFTTRLTSEMEPGEVHDRMHVYRGAVPATQTGRFGLTVRVTPSRQRLENPFIIDLVTWA